MGIEKVLSIGELVEKLERGRSFLEPIFEACKSSNPEFFEEDRLGIFGLRESKFEWFIETNEL